MARLSPATVLTGVLALSTVLVPTLAQARVTLPGANGMQFDIDDGGTGALYGPSAFNGYPELCVRTCVDCDTPCDAADIYQAGGQASVSELGGLQRTLRQVNLNGLLVQRKVTIPAANAPGDANGFIRYLEILTNPGAQPVTVSVRLGTSGATAGRLGQGPTTTVWRTQDDDALPEPTDRWIVTDDDQAQGGAAALAHIAFGAGARALPSVFSPGFPVANDPNSLAWEFRQVTIPPLGTVAFMTLLVAENDRLAAISEAQNLIGMTPEVLYGLSNAERSALLNFDLDPANASPVADAGGPYNANEGDQVQLSAARSVDPVDNLALTYEWDLNGDGVYGDAAGANAIVTFPDDGVYNLNVRVTDPLGKSDVDGARIVVRNVAPHIVAVTTNSPITEGDLLNVDAVVLEPGADTLTYDFDWDGDGNFDDIGLPSPETSHQYFQDGHYEAQMRVTDDDGGQDVTTFSVDVDNVAPRIFQIVTNSPQAEGNEVSIQVIAQDPGHDPITYAYDLDNDGIFELEALELDHAAVTFGDNGQYTIHVRVTDDQGASSTSDWLIPIVNANPVIETVTNGSQDHLVYEGDPVDITVLAHDTPADTLFYSFDLDNDANFADDVQDALEPTLSHIWRQQGHYFVGIFVRDEDGGRARANTTVEVLNAPPVGVLNAPEYVDEGTPFEVTVVASDPGDDIIRYDWDVNGDGVYDLVDSGDASQHLAFPQNGDHTVTVRVHDRDGGELVLTALIHVRHVDARPVVLLPDSISEGDNARIICQPNDIGAHQLSFAFDFDGDGVFDIEGLAQGDTTHVYDDDGLYTVTCAVDDGSSVVFASALAIVHNAPPHVELSNDGPVNEGSEVHLTAQVFDPSPNDVVTLSWDLDGDGVVDVVGEPDLNRTLIAPDNGQYIVTLIATDDDGAESRAQTEITIHNLPPVFSQIAALPPAREGSVWSWVMPATDPAGVNDTLTFELLNPPAGVEIDSFSGFITWTPTWDQYLAQPIHLGIGVHDEDGGRSETELIVNVEPMDDDLDGLPDSWERQFCDDQTPCLDPDADPDADGRTNLDEYNSGSDPSHYDGPPPPENVSPEDTIRVDVPVPTLVIDPKDGEGNPDTVFFFEIYNDAELQSLALQSDAVERGLGDTVSWTPPAGLLLEDATYYWHARAILEPAHSPWTDTWSFTINAVKHAPSPPRLRAPQDNEQVTAQFPTFQCEQSTDEDGDAIHYVFHVYKPSGEVELSNVGEVAESGLVEFTLAQELTENATYTWNAVAVDEEGLESDPSETWHFTINTVNSPPDDPHFIYPAPDPAVPMPVVDSHRPEFKAGGTRDVDNVQVSLVFRLRYADSTGMLTDDDPLVTSDPLPVDMNGDAAWTPSLDLEEDLHYVAEVWATDGQANSQIVPQPFFVSAVNSPPPTPNLKAPLDSALVLPADLFLDFTDVEDPEGGVVTYIVTLCQIREGADPMCNDSPELTDSGRAVPDAVEGASYTWHVVAVDAEGNRSAPSVDWGFRVDTIGGGGNGGGAAGGCGCRTVGAPGGGAQLLPLLALFGLAGVRLRRRR